MAMGYKIQMIVVNVATREREMYRVWCKDKIYKKRSVKETNIFGGRVDPFVENWTNVRKSWRKIGATF